MMSLSGWVGVACNCEVRVRVGDRPVIGSWRGRSKDLVMAGVLRRLALGRGAGVVLARSLNSTAVAEAKVAVVSALPAHL